MRSIRVEELSLEAFAPFGNYGHFLNPETVKIGAAPIEFYRDMVPLNLGAGVKGW